MRAAYSFTAEWTVPAPVGRVAAVLDDLGHYPSWWPQVRAVASLGPATARVICRSRLPYDLDLVLEAVRRPGTVIAPVETLEVRVGGDLEGCIRWHLAAADGGTRMRFEQEVEVGGLLAALSYVARPVLVWNHRSMMRGGERGLQRRLASS